MPSNLTVETALAKLYDRWKDQFEFTLDSYENAFSIVKYKCTVCGYEGQKKVKDFLHRRRGCRKCARIRLENSRKVGWKDVLERFRKRHGDKYDYSKVEYRNTSTEIEIICSEHGSFMQTPENHFKYGCFKCGSKRQAMSKTYDFDELLQIFREKHGTYYNYDKSVFNGYTEPIEIICLKHGSFWQKPRDHMRGHGCQLCATEYSRSLKVMSKELFIERMEKMFPDRFDYSLVEYINAATPVKLICKKHNEVFERIPGNMHDRHKRGVKQGCGKCIAHIESKGEKRIKNYLDKHNIEYQMQYMIKECRNELPLRFDFYLTKYRTLIEYQGIQHYETPFEDFKEKSGGRNPVLYLWDGDKTRKRDQIKRDFVKNTDMELIEIPYWEFDNIENLLDKIINRCKTADDYIGDNI